MKKKESIIDCLYNTHSKYKETGRLKVKGQRKMYHADTNKKEAGLTVIISDKADFRTREIITDKQKHYRGNKGLNSPKRRISPTHLTTDCQSM